MPYATCDILTVFRSLIPDRSAVYLAVPVTSGRRLWELARSQRCERLSDVRGQVPELFRTEVEIPNLAASRLFADQVRQRESYVVNPAEVTLSGWSAVDYMRLWKHVIADYVNKIYLSDGWEFSSGCLEETDLAFSLGIPVFDSQGNTVTREECRDLVREAREAGQELNLECLSELFRRWKVYP